IEEREEYEPHLASGVLVFAGVDYERVLRMAEKEVDVILWDGGNNDLSFFRSDLHIVVVDPHRPGHEMAYHPGEANVRMADVILINKLDTAAAGSVCGWSRTARPCPTVKWPTVPAGWPRDDLVRRRSSIRVRTRWAPSPR